jgi:UDP-N-acetyl-D-mannosaminuronic acid dehydrogenase
MATDNKFFKKVCVMGLGYIGLPTSSILATKGYDVLGVDISQDVVDTINRGEIHIVEPDLDILVKSAVNSGKLKASLEPEEADVFFICVPTPFKDNYKPDISYIENATKKIAPYVKKGNLVILESTSPPKTTAIVAKLLKDNGVNTESDVYVAHAPERVLPGNILHEAIYNDRIIGGINKKSSEVCKAFYKTFVKGPIYTTNAVTAEMAKLCENSFRDVNIAFANELSLIADELEINVWELIELANKHPRVNILNPGPGVGGHCIAVDPWFIVDAAPKQARIIKAARVINDSKPNKVVAKVIQLADKFKNPVIGCLGLAYKPNIDDLRESPAKQIFALLKEEGLGDILVCEPNVDRNELPDIKLDSVEKVISKSDIIVALVAHDEFKDVDLELLKEKVIVDTCGVWRVVSKQNL